MSEPLGRPSRLGYLSKGDNVQVFPVERLTSQVTEARAVLIGRMKEERNRGETRGEHQALIQPAQRHTFALRRSAMFLNPHAPLVVRGQEQVLEILIERARDLPVFAQPLLVDLLERHGVREVLKERFDPLAHILKNNLELILVRGHTYAFQLWHGLHEILRRFGKHRLQRGIAFNSGGP